MCGHEDLEDAIDSGCALVDSSDISSTSARAKRLLRAQVSAAAIAPAIVAAAGSTVAALVPMCFSKLVLLKRFALIIIIALALSAFLGLHLLVPLFMCSAPADLPRPTLRRVGQALFGSGGRALRIAAHGPIEDDPTRRITLKQLDAVCSRLLPESVAQFVR